ncbi:glutathione S-transferase family protein [Roseateles sp. DAIF2]|uniref:glutathione S-transferase family protein n=1 Tax=Roseateles sp. DAIF2 TaxID=2714952 RepID=UPI0018A2C929|nr:glutathione S-transferase family protein [Roseateles sp. DAIF2]QPF76203.1 glutathione S-transferase family protein [Roseateles sp. DAIF2]
MHNFELISNILCPYTQRAAIQLAEKGLEARRTYIDLADKPDWFIQLSPLGKVPVLRVGDAAIFETAVICEYIEEAIVDRTPMWPAHPLDRARHRAWAEFASTVIGDVFGFYMAPDEVLFERKRLDLAERFARLESQLAGAGPYFAGERFGLVDAAFAPIFRLLETFDQLEDFRLLQGLPATANYRLSLAARPSVRAAVVPEYGQVFLRYLAGRGSHMARLAAAAEMTSVEA